MLNIVLPMAGKGSRFAAKGYKLPKPLIDVCGVPMIRVVVDNLCPSCPHRFIFICQKSHLKEYNLEPNSVVIGIDGYTEGQLSTALIAKEYIGDDEELITANTDQFIDGDIDRFLADARSRDLDGSIMTMSGEDPKWSYAKIDSSGLVVEVAEKKVISKFATTGIYYFKKGQFFCKAGEKIIASDERVNGEFYICPCYNVMIAQGKRIGIYSLEDNNASMFGLGTPVDLTYFLNTNQAARLRHKYANN